MCIFYQKVETTQGLSVYEMDEQIVLHPFNTIQSKYGDLLSEL